MLINILLFESLCFVELFLYYTTWTNKEDEGTQKKYILKIYFELDVKCTFYLNLSRLIAQIFSGVVRIHVSYMVHKWKDKCRLV